MDRVVQVSTGYDTTWIWCGSAEVEADVRAILEPLELYLEPAEARHMDVTHVLDVEIGYDAGTSLDALVDAGYRLEYHESEHARDRRSGTIWGTPVTDSHTPDV